MANFYILLEDKLLKISGDITVENITQALGYTPSNFSGDFNDLTNNPFVIDESGEFNIIDEAGNIIAKIDNLGIHTVDIIAGEHVLSNKADISYVDEKFEPVSTKIDTLIGTDTDKSVRTIANEELATLLLAGNDNLQTLQELAAWIEEHPEDAAAMNEAIQTNASNITALENAYKAADTENLNYSKEYTDSAVANIEFEDINNTPFTTDESGELNILDESGNIGFKLESNGIYVKDVIAGNHILSNKLDNIDDLETIRSGAALGATAVQPADISDMETKTNAASTYLPIGNYVKYTAQTLTDELKALVRTNIGALSADDLSNYYTKSEIDSLLGDINTILESIINS